MRRNEQILAVDKQVLTFGFSSVYTQNAYGEEAAGDDAAEGASPKTRSRVPSSDQNFSPYLPTAAFMDITNGQSITRDQRELLRKLEKEGLEFERWLITLATGTVVLSVTLLKGSTVLLTNKGFLISSWIMLVLSIAAGLVDRLLYIFSLSSHPLLDEASALDHHNRWQRFLGWSEKVSWVQIGAFFLGILSLLLFALLSLTT